MGFEKEIIRAGTSTKPNRGQTVTVHCTGYGLCFLSLCGVGKRKFWILGLHKSCGITRFRVGVLGIGELGILRVGRDLGLRMCCNRVS